MKKNICLLMLLALSLPFSLSADQVINDTIANDWPDERYKVHGDGTVTDKVTGLLWMQCSLGQLHYNNGCSGNATGHTWQEAMEVADDYIFADYYDWRLPNIKELSSLVARDRYDPAINSTIFPNTQSGENILQDGYWSASPYANYTYNNYTYTKYAWIAKFYYDYELGGCCRRSVSESDRGNSNYVRLVRSGH